MSPKTIELAKKYHINIDSPRVKLDYSIIPENFSELIPYAELLIAEDQTERDALLNKINSSLKKQIFDLVLKMENEPISLTDWLAEESLWNDNDSTNTAYAITLIRDCVDDYNPYL